MEDLWNSWPNYLEGHKTMKNDKALFRQNSSLEFVSSQPAWLSHSGPMNLNNSAGKLNAWRGEASFSAPFLILCWYQAAWLRQPLKRGLEVIGVGQEEAAAVWPGLPWNVSIAATGCPHVLEQRASAFPPYSHGSSPDGPRAGASHSLG